MCCTLLSYFFSFVFVLSAYAKDPSTADMVQILERQSNWTIEEFLGALKVEHPDYFRFYTLNYFSAAIQKSSYENPRIVLYGNGQTMLAFNGDPNHRGYGHLEMIEYKPGGYEMRVLTFAKDSGELMVNAAEIEKQVGDVTVSVANPRLCKNCHGLDPKPIWDSSSLWAGFYGSDHDEVFVSGNSLRIQNKMDFLDREAAGWKNFQARFAEHPRYRFLEEVVPNENTPVDSVRRNERFSNLLSRQASERFLNAIQDDEQALQRTEALGRCATQLTPELIHKNQEKLNQISIYRKARFEKIHQGTFLELDSSEESNLTRSEFVTRMTLLDLIFQESTGLELRTLSYGRFLDLDLYDGNKGLSDLEVLVSERYASMPSLTCSEFETWALR